MLQEIKTAIEHFLIDEYGSIHGEYKRFFLNGRLSVHTFYQNGIRSGVFTTYHQNGQKCICSMYSNNNIEGVYNKYYENGQLSEHSNFKNGRLHGECRTYDEDGLVNYATFYFQGKDLKVNPDSLSEKDKVYIMMSGRLPPRD